MIIPVGVTTMKNIIPIIKGEINLPSSSPNLNHSLFKGVRIFEFIEPRARKINEITNDQILKSLPFKSG